MSSTTQTEKTLSQNEAIEAAQILKALIAIGDVKVLKNTFISAFKNKSISKSDNKNYLHGNFNLGGTVSGRLSSCVAPWTQILTQRGLLPIHKVVPGDHVWTHKRQWKPVLDVIQKDSAPMVEVTFSNGYTLHCKSSHRLNVPNKGWVSLEEIQSACIKEVDCQSIQHIPSPESLSPISNYRAGTLQAIEYQLSQCAGSVGDAYAREGIQGQTSSQIFAIQEGIQEPYVWKNWRTAPQLYWRLSRWLWLFNSDPQWQTAIRAPYSAGRGSWFRRTASNIRCAPYRWGSFKQRIKQLGSLHKRRSQSNSQLASNKQRGQITAINPCGNIPVWDLHVADDHSYWAEGCFHHNSNPNLQNTPSTGTNYAKDFKKCFKAPKGWLLVGADFSSLEDRIAALTTKDSNKLKIYTDGFDGHSLRAYAYFKDEMSGIDPTSVESINSIQHLYPHLRQRSKGPTFALTYQGTWITLVKNLGFDKATAKKIEANYHELYKESDDWVQDKLAQASRNGYVEVAFGLKVRTPILAKTLLGTKTAPKETAAESRTAGNALGQSYGLLNNRSAIEFMDRVYASQYKYDVKPIAQIHDSQYYLIKEDLDLLQWVNTNLIDCMSWQELPEIQHEQVKLTAELELYYPDMSNPIAIPSGMSNQELKEHINSNI